jgi:ribosomal protein L11 methyltransferase
MPCGKRLWICPTWCTPPQPDAINLILDPGLAFGTGSHATTFLCLEWLDDLDLDKRILIDYGCGSGILAIAAVLMGASRVIAIDNDPQALAATKENARRNDISPGRLLVCSPADQPPVTADYLVANILATPLIELAEHLTGSVKPGGQICLSGINEAQAGAVCQAYTQSFEFELPEHREEWVRLCATRIVFD